MNPNIEDLCRKVTIDLLEHKVFRDALRIEPDALQGLIILRKGIAKGARLLIELFYIIRPVFLQRNTEEDHGLHGGSQVCLGIPFHLDEVPRGFIEEEAICFDVLSESLPLMILHKPDTCMDCARTETFLILNRRAPLPEINGCRGFDLCLVCTPAFTNMAWGKSFRFRLRILHETPFVSIV